MVNGLETDGVLWLGLVNGKAQMADSTITHYLVFPATGVFGELVLKHLFFSTVNADVDGIGLALIERPEGYCAREL